MIAVTEIDVGVHVSCKNRAGLEELQLKGRAADITEVRSIFPLHDQCVVTRYATFLPKDVPSVGIDVIPEREQCVSECVGREFSGTKRNGLLGTRYNGSVVADGHTPRGKNRIANGGVDRSVSVVS